MLAIYSTPGVLVRKLCLMRPVGVLLTLLVQESYCPGCPRHMGCTVFLCTTCSMIPLEMMTGLDLLRCSTWRTAWHFYVCLFRLNRLVMWVCSMVHSLFVVTVLCLQQQASCPSFMVPR